MLALRTPLLQPPNLLWQAGGQATLRDTLLSPVSSGADLTPSSMSPQNHTWVFNLEGVHVERRGQEGAKRQAVWGLSRCLEAKTRKEARDLKVLRG